MGSSYNILLPRSRLNSKLYIFWVVPSSYFLVLQFRLQLLVVLDLPPRLHKVLLDAVVPIFPDREHTCLGTHVSQIRSIKLLADLGESLEVDVALCCNRLGVDLQNLLPGCLVGQRDFHFPVQSTRPQQGRIEDVRPVGGHHHLHSPQLIEAVQLV